MLELCCAPDLHVLRFGITLFPFAEERQQRRSPDRLGHVSPVPDDHISRVYHDLRGVVVPEENHHLRVMRAKHFWQIGGMKSNIVVLRGFFLGRMSILPSYTFIWELKWSCMISWAKIFNLVVQEVLYRQKYEMKISRDTPNVASMNAHGLDAVASLRVTTAWEMNER
jgi:hypothetical protein